MKKERHAILSLIALGRITPAEAERLLAICGEGRQELWVFAVCLTACLAQFQPAHMLLAGGLPALHHAVTAITYWIGGVL